MLLLLAYLALTVVRLFFFEILLDEGTVVMHDPQICLSWFILAITGFIRFATILRILRWRSGCDDFFNAYRLDFNLFVEGTLILIIILSYINY